MEQFSSIDIYKWVREHKDELLYSRITQIYRHGPSLISLGIRTKEKKLFLIIKLPEFIHLSDKKIENHKETVFGSWTRNNIKSLNIKNIEQPGSERIIMFDLGKYKIYFEFFGVGNIIITDDKNKIQISLKRMEGRDIEKEKQYELNQKNYVQISNENLKTLMEEDNQKISKFIATKLHFGGENAKEVCNEAGIDPQKETDPSDALKIKEGIQKVLNKPLDKKIPEEIFNQKSESDKRFEKTVKKYKKIIEVQKKNLKENSVKSEKYKKIGEIIYNNYMLFDELKKKYDEGKIDQNYIDSINKDMKIKYEKPYLEVETE